jgi:hypothetical protein
VFKFIHAADFHLDSSFACALSPTGGGAPAGEPGAAGRLAEYAPEKRGADLMLLAGRSVRHGGCVP